MNPSEQRLEQLAAELGQQLLLAKAQVSTAESCTGGGIAEAITRIAGSSAWFEAGYVTYSNRQKTLQLGVPAAPTQASKALRVAELSSWLNHQASARPWPDCGPLRQA